MVRFQIPTVVELTLRRVNFHLAPKGSQTNKKHFYCSFSFRRNIKRFKNDASWKRTTSTLSPFLEVIHRSKEPEPETVRKPEPKIWKNPIRFLKSPKVRTEIRTRSPAKTEEICSKMKTTMIRAKIHFSDFLFRTKMNNLVFLFVAWQGTKSFEHPIFKKIINVRRDSPRCKLCCLSLH